MSLSALTGNDNYFEDFVVGDVIRHSRGKTVEALENVLLTNLVMNTAQAHFNEHAAQQLPFKRRIVFGGITTALVIGLASQDTAENALAELGVDKLKLTAAVHHGDTLYAYTEVLQLSDADQADAGIVRFRHWGVNQDDKTVMEAERRVLVKRRSHWSER